MITTALALLATVVIFLLTYLTMQGMALPLYMNVLVFMVAHLFIDKVKSEK